MTLLFRDFDRRIEIRSTREGLIRFHRMSEAVLYLRKNFHRTGVVSTLRQILADHQRLQVSRMSDEEVIEEIAQHIEQFHVFGQDTISSFAIYIRGLKK